MKTLGRILFVLAEMFGRPSRERKARIEDQRQPKQHTEPPTVRVIGELQIPEAEIERREADQKRQNRFQRRMLCLQAVGVAVAIATLGAVIYYAVVAADQRDQMIEANRLARSALDANERAWLIGAVAKIDVDKDGIMSVMATFMNAGKSPAFYVRHHGEKTEALVAPVIQLPLGGSGSEITLPQGGTVTSATRFVSIPPQEVREILAGQKQFFFWLAIKYSDPFTGDPNVKDRETLECWTYSLQLKGLAICPRGQFHR